MSSNFRNSRGGFTIVELLIAAAIFTLVLGALTSLFVNTNRAYQVNERVTERQQDAEAAFQLLTYEISLAGYRGSCRDDYENNAFSGDGRTLIVNKGTSDMITVRYFEDRSFAGSDDCDDPLRVVEEQHVTFGVNTADNTLYRQVGTGDELALVSNIVRLEVVHYIRRSGERVAAEPGVAIPEDIGALNIQITFADESVWRFPIGLNNPQYLGIN